MAHGQIQPAFHQPDNTFERFSTRDEARYLPEDNTRLFPTFEISTAKVIDRFINNRLDNLERSIPYRHQCLKDYMSEAIVKIPGSKGHTCAADIAHLSRESDVALLDDRRKHKCVRESRWGCPECVIFCKKLNMNPFYERLKEERSRIQAEKRIVFMPNLTPAGAVALAATVSMRNSVPLKDFLQRYLRRRTRFTLSISWGFFLEFHIPYFALRPGAQIHDRRKYHGSGLRSSEELPLRSISKDRQHLFFYEAQISSLSVGPDEFFWTEYFLVDTYFGSEESIHRYFENSNLGECYDPPSGGYVTMDFPCYDPREYFLIKVERRTLQVVKEFSVLVDTFEERMDDYDKSIATTFKHEVDTTDTEIIGDIITKIKLFSGCISGTVDAWNMFYDTQIPLFFGKSEYQSRIVSIVQNVSELDRNRKVLQGKQEHFERRLKNLSINLTLVMNQRASIQTEIALRQGENITTLTQITVYIAFPLLFTTAFFSMDFLKPELPWLAFFTTLLVATLITLIVVPSMAAIGRWIDQVAQAVRRRWSERR